MIAVHNFPLLAWSLCFGQDETRGPDVIDISGRSDGALSLALAFSNSDQRVSRVFMTTKAGPITAMFTSLNTRPIAPVPSGTRLDTDDKDTREMDVDAKGTSVSDEGARADLDEEVAGSDGSGGMGKIRHVLCPPPIADVDDWGIPPESQRPCDPGVEVGVKHDDAEKSVR